MMSPTHAIGRDVEGPDTALSVARTPTEGICLNGPTINGRIVRDLRGRSKVAPLAPEYRKFAVLFPWNHVEPGIRAARIRRDLLQRRLQPLRRQRAAAQAHACGVKGGVGDRAYRALAGPAGGRPSTRAGLIEPVPNRTPPASLRAIFFVGDRVEPDLTCLPGWPEGRPSGGGRINEKQDKKLSVHGR